MLDVLPPLFEYLIREIMRETTRQLCLRAAKQQVGASPATATAVAIGSGSAALEGLISSSAIGQSIR